MASWLLLAGWFVPIPAAFAEQSAAPGNGAEVAPEVLAAQQQRIEVIARASQAAVAIFAGEAGGGSGVLISADGYALTNFHVVQPAGVAMQSGYMRAAALGSIFCAKRVVRGAGGR